MAKRLIIIISLLAALVSCGGSSDPYDDVPTGASPVVARLDPATGALGTKVTLYGLGFSYVPEMNVVTMGTKASLADSYDILPAPTTNEVEVITFTVPTGLTAGDYPVVVVVHDAPSNADIKFTVTP